MKTKMKMEMKSYEVIYARFLSEYKTLFKTLCIDKKTSQRYPKFFERISISRLRISRIFFDDNKITVCPLVRRQSSKYTTKRTNSN